MDNLKSKILPTAAPPITSFPLIANMLSILWLDKNKTLPWICDRFIQLVARNDIPVMIFFFMSFILLPMHS